MVNGLSVGVFPYLFNFTLIPTSINQKVIQISSADYQHNRPKPVQEFAQKRKNFRPVCWHHEDGLTHYRLRR